MDLEEVIRDAGLSRNEATLYLALLSLGPSLVAALAQKTKLNRTHIYDRLRHLLERGLVSYTIRAGKKYFAATPPEKLVQMLHEKELRLKAALPSFSALQKQRSAVEIEVFQGKEGLKTLLQDCLREQQPMFVLGFRGIVAKETDFFYQQYSRKRLKLGIRRRVLADSTAQRSPFLRDALTTVRFLPPHYHSSAGLWVYGNNTVLFLPEDELSMIRIVSRKTAQFYKTYFRLLWKHARL